MSNNNTAKKHKSDSLKRASALKKTNESQANFFTHVISATNDIDLLSYPDEQFDKILAHSFAQFTKHSNSDHLINIWQPEENDPHASQIVDIFLANIPFVVDSVLGAIR